MITVSQLLRRKPADRLGVNGPDEVKAHPWLKDVAWGEIREMRLVAPFVPAVECVVIMTTSQIKITLTLAILTKSGRTTKISSSKTLFSSPSPRFKRCSMGTITMSSYTLDSRL